MLDRRTSPSGVVYYGSRLLDAVGAAHAFSTRIGGASSAPFNSLNLGNPSGCDHLDSGERIETNYTLLQQAIGCGGLPRCRLHQVHGSTVHAVRKVEPFENGARGDALTSDDPSRVIAVRVADCVPVLLASADGSMVAAVHAGWRGIIAGVIRAAVAALIREHPAQRPGNVIAAIGPCIGQDAFEVGPEVLAEFQDHFGSGAPLVRCENGKGRVDLREACRIELLQAGIALKHVDTTDRCTSRDSEEFFSHRRDNGLTGRMAALIAPAGARGR